MFEDLSLNFGYLIGNLPNRDIFFAMVLFLLKIRSRVQIRADETAQRTRVKNNWKPKMLETLVKQANHRRLTSCLIFFILWIGGY